MRARTLAVLAAVVVALVGVALPASAGPKQGLEISAPSGSVVDYGERVHLVGTLTPWATGQPVQLRDHNGTILVRTKTQRYGKFAFDYAPKRTVYVHATSGHLHSNAIPLQTRPHVTASISGVVLFGTATVSGRVVPWDSGAPVGVAVFHDGKRVATRTARLGSSSAFRLSVPIPQPGTWSAHVVYDTKDSLKGQADTSHVTTPLPSLGRGSSGEAVFLLERRLAQLHYLITNVNQTYDSVTADAVMAFRKVQGLDRVSTVDASVWRRLASPVVPHPRSTGAGFHVEIDQTRQVIYTVQRGVITNILHASTGKPSTPTRDGSFAVHRKVNGFSIGHLYYPSYFDGNRAVHGWTDVPPYPASHGCARIPYWAAKLMYDRMPIGTPVLVYHS
ncbi:MAG TPA: L,D-transpeptidase family protein [Actinomycetota bacterium]|jgi:lipoprotein-anchoring transpeptidase ErfK/SrfK